MEDSRKDEVQLAFSFSDKDFMDFLPASEEEQFYTRWSDFNFHDPGVTTYEAMQLSFEDFFYRYDFPIEDLMQGRRKNAFDDWGVNDLYSMYAVTEDDYRRVLATSPYIKNIAVKPVLNANLNPNTPDLICLLNVNVATDIGTKSGGGIVNGWENALIKNRAVGEYFNRQRGQATFIRDKKKRVKVRTKVSLYPISEDRLYFRKIFAALENYLLPNIESVDYRTVNKRDVDLSKLFIGPAPNDNHQQNVINQELLNQPAYRRFIVVSELFEVLENLDFIRSVSYVRIATENGQYESTVLDLGDYTFTELFELEINNELPEFSDPMSKSCEFPLEKESDSFERLPKHERTDFSDLNRRLNNPSSESAPNFMNEMQVKGRYRDLKNSPSLQTSFPPNYNIGRFLVDQDESEQTKTASFRAFLYLMDQVRANISGQMGAFHEIFSVSEELPSYVEANISERPIYTGIDIPDLSQQLEHDSNNPKKNVSRYSYLAESEEVQSRFTEERLNYLLAINGWGIGVNASTFWSRTDYTKIKNDFLNLVHYFPEDPYPIKDSPNICFQSKSLVLLQEKLRVILQFDVEAVRVLEHFFLQPVWEGERGLNFELTVFLFEKSDARYISAEEDCKNKNYIELVIRDMIPAHIVESVKWIPFNGQNPSKTLELYDEALKVAIPPGSTYYLNSEISTHQRQAMNWLKNDWIQQ